MRLPLVLASLCGITAAGLVLWPQAAPVVPREPAPQPEPAAPVTPATLAEEVQKIRGLRFVRPLTFSMVPAAELEKHIRHAMQAAVPAAEGARLMRTAIALGLIHPGLEFDAADCLTGSAMEIPAAHYDDASATLWVNDAFSPDTRPDLTIRLVLHLSRALLQQQPGRNAQPDSGIANDDARLTALALEWGDATLTTRAHTLQYAGRSTSASTTAVPEVFTYHASPPFLRAVLAFPGNTADIFHRSLQEAAPDAELIPFLQKLQTRPPLSTAELLHPGTYPAAPAPPLAINRSDCPDLPVLTENTLGEFGILTMLKTQLPAEEATRAAAGWVQDRYLILTGTAPGQDHLLWRSRWATPEDAREFLRALTSAHLGNAGMIPEAAHFANPGKIEIRTPALTLLGTLTNETTVTFSTSPDPATAARLIGSQ